MGGPFVDIKKFWEKMRRESLKNFRKKSKNENFEQSQSAENSEKREPSGFFNIRSVTRYQTKRWVDPL